MSSAPSTLPELFEDAARRFAAAEALGAREGSHFRFQSYRDLSLAIRSLRGSLRAWGIRPGDTVALIADNCVDWVIVAFATYGVGAVLVPLYEAQPADDWHYILSDSQARLAFVRTSKVEEKLAPHRARLPELEHVATLEPEGLASFGASFPAAPSAEGLHPLSAQDRATILYTSGTTGRPKGVCLSHGNICSNVRASAQRYRFGPGDRSLAFLPWAHAFGQTAELFVLLWSGATVIINDDIHRLAEDLARFRPTVLVAVPRVLSRISARTLAQVAERPLPVRKLFHAGIAASTRRREGRPRPGDRALCAVAERLFFRRIRQRLGGRLRFVVSGSAALSPEVAALVDALGVTVFEGYGMTEASPVITSNYPGHRKLGSVGLPFPDVHVRIEPCADAPQGEGEILVSGPNIMQGYHHLPEETAKVLLPDGSLRTGDLGRLDADGYLFLTGRIKEQYKLENGKYVVPSPLEEQLKLGSAIEQVMLYGDGRPFNVALVVVDLLAVRQLLGRSLSHEQAAADAQVRELVAQDLRNCSASFKGYERPQAFALCPAEFSLENGLLTPSLKIRRKAIFERYGGLLAALYSPQGGNS